MGWVWREDVEADGTNSFDITNPSRGSGSDDRCSTRRFITSKCTTEEVEPGKFVRKCQKTEQILRDCLGKPTEVVQSNKEYTEDDVTEEVMKGPTIPGSAPFEFPGLRSDIEAIERSLFGGINRFFEAAEDMRNGFFRLFDDHHVFGGDSSTSSLSSSGNRGVAIEGCPEKEAAPMPKSSASGDLDLSGLAREV
ncbi:hypothetical protein Nepgr_011521 [Nepenthes gracilis]|uniref:Mal d 1-associated protein n=1 Tax=Nepenthes gracilis TaxID=150966 RepID=A0AAD3SE73_NEPGR|nr:hypothetical protein Nepgr_011521 [Nepenthes gracilis]